MAHSHLKIGNSILEYPMSNDITKERLEQLLEKAEKAHSGTWVVEKNEFNGKLSIMLQFEDGHSIHQYQLADILFAGTPEDADFIASFSPDTAKAIIQKCLSLMENK